MTGAARLVLLALLAAAAALSACGRKGEPERPPLAVSVEPAVEPGDDDDPFFGNPPPATPGPEVEEEVDDQLSG